MKEVIIILGTDCQMRVSSLMGVIACICQRPQALVITVSDGKRSAYNNYWQGKITAANWMAITFQRDFGIKNLILVEERVGNISRAISKSREILKKKNLLDEISTVIIFCKDGKEKNLKHQTEKVFEGRKEIQVFTFPVIN